MNKNTELKKAAFIIAGLAALILVIWVLSSPSSFGIAAKGTPTPQWPFDVIDCAALDFDSNALPDVLACEGGAYNLSPFGQ